MVRKTTVQVLLTFFLHLQQTFSYFFQSLKHVNWWFDSTYNILLFTTKRATLNKGSELNVHVIGMQRRSQGVGGASVAVAPP